MKNIQAILKRYGVIFLLTFINGLSMLMLVPVLPFFIKMYDQPEFILWLMVSIFSFFQFFAAPIMWALSDKYGRKPVLVLTQAGTMVSWLVLWIVYFVPQISIFWVVLLPVLIALISRAFDGITWGNVSVAQAMLSDLTAPRERTKIFGMNSAFFGLSLMTGPALWALAMSTQYSFLWTALLGALFSLITLVIMIFKLQETLPPSERDHDMQIDTQTFHIIKLAQKWLGIETIRYSIIMKLFLMVAFMSYTTISALYLIDVFGFDEKEVWLYLIFTWSFLIVHQSISVAWIVWKLRDRKSLLLWMLLVWIAFIGMWLTKNIIVFTCFYCFAVLGISLSISTTNALISRSVNRKSQWEVMGFSSSIDSLVAIIIPLIATIIYPIAPISIYIILGIIPILGFIWSRVSHPNIVFSQAQE